MQTGAGTATVARVLLEKINEGTAPGDRVSGENINQKVRRHEGIDNFKITDRKNKTPKPPNEAMQFSVIAIVLVLQDLELIIKLLLHKRWLKMVVKGSNR